MQVLAYVRVSTDEQADNGGGLEAQREAIAAECNRRGWKLIETIEDAGHSARTLKRPGIQKALARLDRGEADGLLVAKLDRLSRSMMDFTATMAQAQKRGWALVALDAPVDTTTPAGEAMANVLATFAQFERRLIGQRTKEALEVKRKAGVKLGRPRQLPAKIATRVTRERKAGATLAAIADGLNRDQVATAQGGAKWYPSTVRAVLHLVK
jgi:DNA invertase Pin-like site-specific DNA recombinase